MKTEPTYYTLSNLAPSTRNQRTGETFDIVRFPDATQIGRIEDGIITIDKYPFKESDLASVWRPSDKLEWDIAVELLKEQIKEL